MCFPGNKSVWDQEVEFVNHRTRPPRKNKGTETIILRRKYSPRDVTKPSIHTETPSKSTTTAPVPSPTPASARTPNPAPSLAPSLALAHPQNPISGPPSTAIATVPKPIPVPDVASAAERSPSLPKKSEPSPSPSPSLEWIYVEEQDEMTRKKRNKSRNSRASTRVSSRDSISCDTQRDISRVKLPPVPAMPMYDTYRYVEGTAPRYSRERSR